jgi:hypothetical protein
LTEAEYLVGGLGPFEGLWVLVVAVDEGADVGLQLPDRSMNASPGPLSGELCKPALDLIDP